MIMRRVITNLYKIHMLLSSSHGIVINKIYEN